MWVMFRLISRGLLVLTLLVGAPVLAQPIEPPPISAYGNLPEVEDVALSFDGERLAAVMTANGQRKLFMFTKDLELLRTIPLQDEKIRSLNWVGNDRLLLIFSQTSTLPAQYVQSQFEFFHGVVVSTDQSIPNRVVFDNDPTIVNAIFGTFGVRQVDGHWYAFLGGVEKERGARDFYIQNGQPALFAYDIESYNRRRLADPGSNRQQFRWVVGSDGEVAATLAFQPRAGQRWSITASGGKVLTEGTSDLGEIGLRSLGRNGDSVIYAVRGEEDRITRIYEVMLDGSSEPQFIATADEIRSFLTDDRSGRLLGWRRQGENTVPQMYDPAHQARVNSIYEAFEGLHVDLGGWTSDFERALVRTSGNGDSGTWYFVDLAANSANAIGYERVAIEPRHVGPISHFAYTAGDGLALDGILTLPPGRDAANLPLVVLPHGGPHAHDEATFDWWAQAFAARGYAVFQPNFRGSTGREEAFMVAGFGQWGRLMQTDISDGVGALAAQGTIDPQRVCIMGASYGGYAALAGVTLQQGIYRCAVAVAGISDISRLFSDENRGGGPDILHRSLYEELGPRSGFDAISPRNLADRAEVPILMIHGRDDTVVPFDQSKLMADALDHAHKPYKLVELREEDHWLSRAETRLQMLEEALAFVQEHNPAD